MRETKERLRDILEAIAAIERYSRDGRKAFEGNELIQGWFLLHLQTIGEAARNIPGDIQAVAPGIDWKKIMGMRNILAHAYFRVDHDVVWDTVQVDLPPLKKEVEALLAQLKSGE